MESEYNDNCVELVGPFLSYQRLSGGRIFGLYSLPLCFHIRLPSEITKKKKKKEKKDQSPLRPVGMTGGTHFVVHAELDCLASSTQHHSRVTHIGSHQSCLLP